MGSDLRTTEQYALAQILVSGAITYDEFCQMNEMLGKVQDDTLGGLAAKDYLDYTLIEL
jgi:hypothetical protein